MQDISQLIVAQNQSKKDFIVNTGLLTMEPTQDQKDVQIGFSLKGQKRLFTPTSLCLGQIADRVGIPKKYADRMRAEAPGLLATNINHWFTTTPEKRMLRTLNHDQNIARAFLGESYRPLDNFDLAQIALPKLEEVGCEIHSCEITEKRLYIQASTPRIQSIIEQETRIGGHHQIKRTVQAGCIIGNSEVGMGSIFVEPIMYDLVCTNGLILQRTLRKYHAGRRNEGEIFGDENTFELYSDETRRLDDKAFWAKVRDVIGAAMDQIKFNENIERLRKTQTEKLADKPKEVEEVVEVASRRFEFSDDEKGSLLMHFAQGGDFSKYGLINAVTRTAEDSESYDRAVELERLGGQIIEMAPTSFMKN